MRTFAISYIYKNGIARELQSSVRIEMPFTDSSGVFTAIWDTGATNSVINDRVAAELELIPTGFMECHGVHGKANMQTYFVNLGLLNYTEDGGQTTLWIDGLQVSRSDSLPGCDVLIGMDVIGMGDFSVTNFGGTTVYSFRIPSQHHIDYYGMHNSVQLYTGNFTSPTIPEPQPIVQAPASAQYAGTARNAPCPCGSGQKYKRCHGA